MMTITTTTSTLATGTRPTFPVAATTDAHAPQRVWRSGLVAGIAASFATMAVAAIADAAGVSLDVAGEPIPLTGFATLTMLGAVLGIALAAVLGRRVRHPRPIFVRVTIVLTVLSLVPDVIADADIAARLVLGLTHIIAAAVIVPPLARRLAA